MLSAVTVSGSALGTTALTEWRCGATFSGGGAGIVGVVVLVAEIAAVAGGAGIMEKAVASPCCCLPIKSFERAIDGIAQDDGAGRGKLRDGSPSLF